MWREGRSRDWKSLEKLFEFRIEAKARNLLGKAFDRFLQHGFTENFLMPHARPSSCCQPASDQCHPGKRASFQIIYDRQALARKVIS